jgi:hypothetical protein
MFPEHSVLSLSADLVALNVFNHGDPGFFPLYGCKSYLQGMVMDPCLISSDNAVKKFMAVSSILLRKWHALAILCTLWSSSSAQSCHCTHACCNPNPCSSTWQTDIIIQVMDHNPSVLENYIFDVSCSVCRMLNDCHCVHRCLNWFVQFWRAHAILLRSAISSQCSFKLWMADEFLLQTHSLCSETELLPVLFAWTTFSVESPCITGNLHHTCSAEWFRLWTTSGCITNTVIITNCNNIINFINLFLDSLSYVIIYVTGL